jgi:predicted DNA-binding transcriptional regulator AlpA
MVTTNQYSSLTLTRPKQTADFFQISLMTLHRWRSQKGFPQPLKRGQVVLYDVAAIEAWLTCGEAV